MKTLTFYSYKGGVGRSLVLANLAQRLVEFGKSVCMLDFDLEAPGLTFKFGARKILDLKKKGVVDFVTEYQATKKPLQELGESYWIRLNEERKNQAPLYLITAGNTDTQQYWKNLAAIDWKEMFYSEGGQGYRLMLHLKALIENELKPDYLLIDSRTGVTETSGIALSILADRVVMVAANNEENLYGSKMIIKGIQQETQPTGRTADIHFILSRVPFTKEPNDRLREKDRIDALAKELKDDGVNIAEPGILLIHSERELEVQESLMIGDFKTEEPVHIGDDYRKIFKYVISQDFEGEEFEKYEKQEKASALFSEYQNMEDKEKKLSLINSCIELNPTATYYYERGSILEGIKGRDGDAIKDYEKAIELDTTLISAYVDLSILLYRHKDIDIAIEVLTNAIDLFPDMPSLYFGRSLFEPSFSKKESNLLKAISLSENNLLYFKYLIQLYFDEGNYELAYNYAYKALEKFSNDSQILYLLAKLQFVYKHNLDEFYLNLDRALETHKSISEKLQNDEFFRPFLNEERFKRLLYKYNIEMKLPTEPPAS